MKSFVIELATLLCFGCAQQRLYPTPPGHASNAVPTPIVLSDGCSSSEAVRLAANYGNAKHRIHDAYAILSDESGPDWVLRVNDGSGHGLIARLLISKTNGLLREEVTMGQTTEPHFQ
jgi:hypothetical protein